jgi:two-component system response regulator YesN
MMYQMLLVDDEIHAIEGVKSDLNLEKLQIRELYTANCMQEAQEIFENNKIDIMLCDIEMPQGSGLDLLSWVRERHPHTVTIFLTSHADFKYAKEAVKLGSLDYLLKPVLATDLEEVIQRAQSVFDRNTEINRNSQSHQLWTKHHSFIIERFWLDLINHSTPSHSEAIREQVERHHIPITDESVFLPILLSVQRWNKELNRRDEKILEYALLNTAEEIILKNGANGICFQIDKGSMLVILAANRGNEWEYKEIVDVCQTYIDSCNQYFYCDLSCFIGITVEASEMARMVAELKNKNRNNVTLVNRVFLFNHTGNNIQPAKLPVQSNVSSLLKTGSMNDVIHEMEVYLSDLIRNQGVDAEILHRFNQDFMQVLYSYLNTKGILANQLFGDEESRNLSELAGRSVTDMKHWVHHAIRRAMHQADAVNEMDKVIDTIKRYIELNLDQDLSREKIAEQVYMSPGYISRIFKNETGCNLSDYVLLERINRTKELLAQTKIPISSIATSVGYNNFSHFAKIFKKYVGISPSEYRG